MALFDLTRALIFISLYRLHSIVDASRLARWMFVIARIMYFLLAIVYPTCVIPNGLC